jgi:hypothetical protein
MTETTTAAPSDPTTLDPTTLDQTTLDPTARQRARRWVRPTAIVLALLVLAVLIGALSASGPSGYLQPTSAEPQGGLALRHLLEQQGVQVDVVTGIDGVLAQANDGTTVLAPDLAALTPDVVQRLAQARGDLVVTDPTSDAVPALAPGMSAGDDVTVQTREPGCALQAATLAGSATTGGLTVKVGPAGPRDVVACYAEKGEGTVVRVGLGDGRSVTFVGDGSAFTNGSIADEGNAALALNLLGANPEVVWYAPDPNALPESGGTGDLTDLLPPWVGLVVWQLVVAVAVAALWRGRRLGPVVAEQLPVAVRAAETTEGRALLYRRRGARGRAAEHLRAATLSRLRGPLGLPVAGSRDAVVARVAARSGWSPTDVAGLLYGAAPQDDAALVRLAAALDALERQVRA